MISPERDDCRKALVTPNLLPVLRFDQNLSREGRLPKGIGDAASSRSATRANNSGPERDDCRKALVTPTKDIGLEYGILSPERDDCRKALVTCITDKERKHYESESREGRLPKGIGDVLVVR